MHLSVEESRVSPLETYLPQSKEAAYTFSIIFRITKGFVSGDGSGSIYIAFMVTRLCLIENNFHIEFIFVLIQNSYLC